MLPLRGRRESALSGVQGAGGGVAAQAGSLRVLTLLGPLEAGRPYRAVGSGRAGAHSADRCVPMVCRADGAHRSDSDPLRWTVRSVCVSGVFGVRFRLLLVGRVPGCHTLPARHPPGPGGPCGRISGRLRRVHRRFGPLRGLPFPGRLRRFFREKVFGPAPAARTGPNSGRASRGLLGHAPQAAKAKGRPMTMSMTLIHCSQCPAGKPSPYQAQPDFLFRYLECGYVLDVRDLVLDPEEEWMVSPDGLLGYSVDEPETVAYGLEGAFAAVHRGAGLLGLPEPV